MIPGKPGAFSISIMWTPLIFIIFALALSSRLGFYYSLGIYSITLCLGIFNSMDISPDYVFPLIQFYIANLVYIVVFYFAQNMFSVYAELQNAKRTAYNDSLTGVANRHRIDIWLGNELNQAQQHNSPFSIIFFDLDHFKRINDTYGHIIGDNVLKELTILVKKNLPAGNRFGRWGGEEFIIISNYSMDDALTLAEELREVIEKYDFHSVDKITSSFGVTSFQQGDTLESLIHRADNALYMAKNSGRNLVTSI